MQPEEVTSRKDLAQFLAELAEMIQEEPEGVDNSTLPSFLSGAAGWVRDMHGYFMNTGEKTPNEPTWALIASIFSAATVYE